jgi:hypothetical protein
MNASNQLRKLAKELRDMSQTMQEDRQQKCAQVLVAARGLSLLKKRLTREAGR